MNYRNKESHINDAKVKVVAVFLSLAVVIAFFFVSGKTKEDEVYAQTANDMAFGEITAEHSLATSLHIENKIRLTRISIMFATYARENTCEVDFSLYKNNKCVYSYTLEDASVLLDNSYFELEDIDVVVAPEDEIYLLITSPDGERGNAVTVWMLSDEDNSGTYIYNYYNNEGTAVAQCAKVSIYGIVNLDVEIFITIIWLVVLCIAAILLFVFFSFSIPVEKRFAIVTVTIGSIYLLTITPLAPPDEAHHYHSSYQLSNFLMLQWENAEKGNSEHFNYSNLVVHQNVASGYQRIVKEIGLKVENGKQIDIPIPRSLAYFVEYLPQAAGVSFARLLNLNFIWIFILGRSFNLLFYSLCLYFAVKRTPRFKVLLGLIGTMPMALHQAASFSYDVFVNGMSFVLIASFLKAIYEKDLLPVRDYRWILISGMLLAPAKIVYTVILLLVFLIPKQRFNGTKDRLKKIVALFVLCAAIEFAFQISTIIRVSGLNPSSGLNWEGQSNYTLLYIFEHPLSTVKIFWNTFVRSAKVWFEGSIGANLSALSIPIPKSIIWLFCCLALLSMLEYEYSEFVISGKARAIFLAIVCITAVMVMLSMFLCYTSDTRQIILGVQGRYFIPVLPLLFMSCNNQIVVLRKSVEKFCICFAILLHVRVIYQILAVTCGW